MCSTPCTRWRKRGSRRRCQDRSPNPVSCEGFHHIRLVHRSRDGRRPSSPGKRFAGAKLGQTPVSPAAHLRTLTRRSNHAACPVTGSEFVIRLSSAAPFGSSSHLRCFKRTPPPASGALSESPHVPACLPTAFQVHPVLPSTPSMVLSWQRMRPWCDVTHTQSKSPSPSR